MFLNMPVYKKDLTTILLHCVIPTCGVAIKVQTSQANTLRPGLPPSPGDGQAGLLPDQHSSPANALLALFHLMNSTPPNKLATLVTIATGFIL